MLWLLGDFCWGKLAEATSYRNRILCRNVHLVWGNHDHHSIRPLFGEAIEQGMIEVEGQAIWLNHYPMRSWNRSFHGSWHFYGHVHGRLSAEDARNDSTLTKDVGVDACSYRPWSFAELREYMAPRVVKFNERKAALRDSAEDPPV
jgi:calcineurin-like phosphoesterase family protein